MTSDGLILPTFTKCYLCQSGNYAVIYTIHTHNSLFFNIAIT